MTSIKIMKSWLWWLWSRKYIAEHFETDFLKWVGNHVIPPKKRNVHLQNVPVVPGDPLPFNGLFVRRSLAACEPSLTACNTIFPSTKKILAYFTSVDEGISRMCIVQNISFASEVVSNFFKNLEHFLSMLKIKGFEFSHKACKEPLLNRRISDERTIWNFYINFSEPYKFKICSTYILLRSISRCAYHNS